ncbi:hypothetical protein [Beggiatoa leptomitoformis]|uniref:Big-1 domain-containing protein n=1 Tax=Beggiatoa leptomitoformis TaxID=288004 RepID=A0A2N9YIL7_9GAMM|nr:hypothetical protein [Beggiatoa leptomitoformis]ALG67439.1 hypothetical protein AL038_06645 [Beggiatoa leptomitoformis]AUI70344.1 hypothetical protein BLE401_17660 [Beggiatoa leptomitoformis]
MSKTAIFRLVIGFFLAFCLNSVFAATIASEEGVITATAEGTSPTVEDEMASGTTVGTPTTIVVLRGGKQSVPLSVKSQPVIFKVTDEHGNPVSGVHVNFALQRNGSPVASTGLSSTTGVSNAGGVVSTRVQPTTVTGAYTVTAIVSDNLSLTASATLKVTASLPSLGNGAGVGRDGKSEQTGSLFGGGFSVNDGEFVKKGKQKLSDSCLVQGIITTDSADVGKQVDLIVVAAYVIPELNFSAFFVLDEVKGVVAWDLDMATLTAFKSDETLEDKQIVTIYDGQFVATGQLLVFYGYRLPNGKVVFNAEQVLDITIDP